MLEVEIKSERNNITESRVRNILKEEIHGSERSIYGLQSWFYERLRELPKVNTTTAEWFYKIFPDESMRFAECWHLNRDGEPKRRLAIIKLK